MDKNIRLATYASRCIENEILMHFRSRRKSSQDVSLSDYIESGDQGNALSLMDVIAEDDDMLERITSRENARRVRAAVETCLTDQERQVIVLRYGLMGHTAQRQREVAEAIGISRSYVFRPGYCKRKKFLICSKLCPIKLFEAEFNIKLFILTEFDALNEAD